MAHPDDQCDAVGFRSEAETPVQFGSGLVWEFCDGCAEERVAVYDEARYYDQ